MCLRGSSWYIGVACEHNHIKLPFLLKLLKLVKLRPIISIKHVKSCWPDIRILKSFPFILNGRAFNLLGLA